MANTVKKMGNIDSGNTNVLIDEKQVKSEIVDGSILIKMVLQIAGSPAEHIDKTMDLVLEKVKETKDAKVSKEDVYRAKADETDTSVFVSFTELEILVKNVNVLTGLCYDYMPASIEILEPTELKITSHDQTMFLNDILARLHKIDMTLKNKTAENKILNDNCLALFKNIFKISLKSGPKTKEELSVDTGISVAEMDNLIKGMVQENLIYEKGDKIYDKDGKRTQEQD